MISYFRSLLDSRSGVPRKGGPLLREPASTSGSSGARNDRVQTYTRVFRYRLPDGQTSEPKQVEVVGSFTHWQPVVMQRDSALDAWHVTIHHIVGNRTHHYMLLVDGQPVHDKTCDGFAVPHGANEERYQIATDKGPRVLMLFAQAR
jgi:hypothetical protein